MLKRGVKMPPIKISALITMFMANIQKDGRNTQLGSVCIAFKTSVLSHGLYAVM